MVPVTKRFEKPSRSPHGEHHPGRLFFSLNPRKAELRKIVLDIVTKREHVHFDPFHFGHLTAGVAEILGRGNIRTGFATPYQTEARLDEEDWISVQEIFWDLVYERVLTIGQDKPNPDFPWFRLHSEAGLKLD